jgi:hypothetical protein
MPWEQLSVYLLYIGALVGGWLLRELWSAMSDLRRDISRLREEVGRTYMPRDEIRELHNEILHELREIRTELKQKADK